MLIAVLLEHCFMKNRCFHEEIFIQIDRTQRIQNWFAPKMVD